MVTPIPSSLYVPLSSSRQKQEDSFPPLEIERVCRILVRIALHLQEEEGHEEVSAQRQQQTSA